MLIIRDGICYVHSENLSRYELPSTVIPDKKEYEPNEYARFFDPITILYFKAREDMIDYDDVACLSDVELDTMIYGARSEINRLNATYAKETFDRKAALLKNSFFINNARNLVYKFFELKHYKDNREEIDTSIKNMTKSMSKVKEL